MLGKSLYFLLSQLYAGKILSGILLGKYLFSTRVSPVTFTLQTSINPQRSMSIQDQPESKPDKEASPQTYHKGAYFEALDERTSTYLLISCTCRFHSSWIQTHLCSIAQCVAFRRGKIIYALGFCFLKYGLKSDLKCLGLMFDDASICLARQQVILLRPSQHLLWLTPLTLFAIGATFSAKDVLYSRRHQSERAPRKISGI